MLTRVDIRRFNRLVLSNEVLSLHFPDVTGVHRPFILNEVGGLGPVKADIATMEYASVDGELFLSASTGGRNVTLSVGLNPNYKSGDTIADLRERLYSVAPPKEHVTLTFIFDDRPTVATNGWVETNDPNIFSRDTSMTLSIVCISPYLELTTVKKAWANPAAGLLVDYQEIQDIGFILEGTLTADTPTLTLNKTGAEKPMILKNLKANDRIRWCTIPGRKTLWLTRGGVSGDALTLVDNKTTWYDIRRDDTNYFWFSTGAGNLSNLTMTYTPLKIGA